MKILSHFIYDLPRKTTNSGIPAATDQTKANSLVNCFFPVFTKKKLEDVSQPPQQYPDIPDITFGEKGVYTFMSNTNPSNGRGPDHITARF